MKTGLHRMAALAAFFSLAAGSAGAQQKLTELKFGTNWVAQAEHGGYYQAVADGTYEKYGLDVTIVPGRTAGQQPHAAPRRQDRLLHGRQHDPGLLGRRGEHPDPRRRRASSRRIRRSSSRHPGQGSTRSRT